MAERRNDPGAFARESTESLSSASSNLRATGQGSYRHDEKREDTGAHEFPQELADGYAELRHLRPVRPSMCHVRQNPGFPLRCWPHWPSGYGASEEGGLDRRRQPTLTVGLAPLLDHESGAQPASSKLQGRVGEQRHHGDGPNGHRSRNPRRRRILFENTTSSALALSNELLGPETRKPYTAH